MFKTYEQDGRIEFEHRAWILVGPDRVARVIEIRQGLTYQPRFLSSFSKRRSDVKQIRPRSASQS